MTRLARSHHAHRFTDESGFNEQMYSAVRQSPWWLLSLTIHALVFAIAAMLPTAQAEVPTPPQIQSVLAPPEEPVAQEPEEAPEDVQSIHPQEMDVPDPTLPTDNPDPVDERDVDIPNSEGTYGDSDIPQMGAFEGNMTNAMIGPGPGAGPFGGRRGGDSDRRKGSTRVTTETQDVVEDALAWLAAHQSPDGRWEAAGFHQWCDGKVSDEAHRPEGQGRPMYDPGVTGLALCAFLGAGYAPRGDHRFAKVVQRGLRYLKNVQDPEGCFGPRTTQHFIYNHATAALAMVEAYGMTDSGIWKASAQKALEFIAIARNPYFAWRYGVKPGENDTSVTGWMMMALKSAKLVNEDAARRGKAAPFAFDEEAFDGIRTWVDKMTDEATGRVGYVAPGSGPARPTELVDRFPTDKSESMTAVGVLARIFIGEDPKKSPAIQKGARLMESVLPTWNSSDGSIDMYYWYYATLAMFQVGGDSWLKWNKAMVPSIVSNQRKDGDFCLYKGSFDPIDPWGPDGGRVYSTALLAMCLEVYYRYDRVIGTR